MEEKSIRKYLRQNDILIRDCEFSMSKEYTEEEAIKQIILINSVHKILMGYYDNVDSRIHSIIGKKAQKIKVDIKKAKKHLYELEIKKEKNIMDKFLLENGQDILVKADEAIKNINKLNYIDLIKRSMKKNEICLGKVDERNIRVSHEIEIGNIKGLSYNLVEEDIVNYLRKIRQKNNNIDIEKLICRYVELANLGKNSEEYIYYLISVPLDSIKVWGRYRENKRKITPREYIKSIELSLIYEKTCKRTWII